MPDWLWVIKQPPQREFLSGSGIWQFAGDECDWDIYLRFEPFTGYPDGLSTILGLGGRSPDYYLCMGYLGGADSGQVMYFEKVK